MMGVGLLKEADTQHPVIGYLPLLLVVGAEYPVVYFIRLHVCGLGVVTVGVLH